MAKESLRASEHVNKENLTERCHLQAMGGLENLEPFLH